MSSVRIQNMRIIRSSPDHNIFQNIQMKSKQFHLLSKAHEEHSKPILSIRNLTPTNSRNVCSNWKDGDKDGDGKDKECEEQHEEIEDCEEKNENECEEIEDECEEKDEEQEEKCETDEEEVREDEVTWEDTEDESKQDDEEVREDEVTCEDTEDDRKQDDEENPKTDAVEELEDVCDAIDDIPDDASTYKNQAYFQYDPYSYYDYFIDMKSKDYFCPVPNSKEPLETCQPQTEA